MIVPKQGQILMRRNGMGDLPNSNLQYRVLTAQRGALGPLNSPIESAKKQDASLSDILEMLKAMPFMIWNEYRLQLMMPGREALPFSVVTPNVSVAAAATGQVATFNVNERFAGAIMRIGAQIDPPSAFSDLDWFLRINGAIHPGFQQLQLPSGSIANPIEFKTEITQRSTVDLLVTNNGAMAVVVSAILMGYTELLDNTKSWGTSPKSGIG